MSLAILPARVIDLDKRCKHEMPIGTCSWCLSLSEEIPFAATFGICIRCGSQIMPGDAIIRVRVGNKIRWVGECCG